MADGTAAEEAEAGDFGCSGWMGSGVREWGGKYGKYSRAGGNDGGGGGRW